MTLPFDVHWPSFGLGAVVLILLGFVLVMATWFGKDDGSPFAAQKVVLTTKRTPWQVSIGCLASFLLIVGFASSFSVAVLVLLLGAGIGEVTWILVLAVATLLVGAVLRTSNA